MRSRRISSVHRLPPKKPAPLEKGGSSPDLKDKQIFRPTLQRRNSEPGLSGVIAARESDSIETNSSETIHSNSATGWKRVRRNRQYRTAPRAVVGTRGSKLVLDPDLHEGWLRYNKNLKWFKLKRYKLECYDEMFSEIPNANISLEFRYLKRISSAKEKWGFKICSNGGDASQTALLYAENEDERDKWITKICEVLSLFQKQTKNGAWVGTWNVGNAIPGDLTEWIPHEERYDIYAIGAQECVYKARNGQHSVHKDWDTRITVLFGEDYEVIATHSLMEIRNIVIIKKELIKHVSQVGTHSVPTGIGNVVGNKGGVGISFMLYDASFCFISAHFAAHQEEVQSRNENFKDILSGLNLSNPKGIDVTNMFQFVFWYGDLNYRIEASRSEVLRELEEGHYTNLLCRDQLMREKEESKVFEGFKEGDICFPPTYKYVSDLIDENGSRVYTGEKLRVPSWCDRILWKTFPVSKISSGFYKCCQKVLTSDHAPVNALFNIGCRLPHYYNSSVVPTSDNDPPRCYMRFFELKATGLSMVVKDKKMNPYIKFVGSFINDEKKWKTKILYKTTEPHWNEVAPIPLSISNRSYIKSQHVILVLMSEVEMGNNKGLGQAVLPLSECCGSAPQPFEVKIYRHGRREGTVFGKCLIQWANFYTETPTITLS